MRQEFIGLLDKVVSPSYAWGPFSTFVQTRALAEILALQGTSLHGKTCVDFGCGAVRPLSVSAMMYLLGAARTLAIDMATPGDRAHIAVGLYSLVVAVLSGRLSFDASQIAVTPEMLRKRCAAFDLAALLEGDMRGVPEAMQLRTGDYVSLPKHERRFDFLTSYSVLEHVSDVPGYLAAFRESVSNSGIIFAAIDYRDHRAYTIGASPWQYLLDDQDHSPGYINKIRHSEMLRLIASAGFTVTQSKLIRQEPLSLESQRFIPRYGNLSEEDIKITEAHLLLAQV